MHVGDFSSVMHSLKSSHFSRHQHQHRAQVGPVSNGAGTTAPALRCCRSADQNLAREGSFTRSQATSKHKQTNIMHIIYMYIYVCVIHIISPGLIRFHLDFYSNYRFALPVTGVKLAILLVLSREDWSGHFSVTRFKATHRFDSTSYKHVSCSIM